MPCKILTLLFCLIASNVSAQEALTAIRDNTTRSNIASVNRLGSKYGLGVDEIPATTIYNGQVTVATAGTRQQLSASSVPIRSVCIKAQAANTGKIYLGDSTVSASNGYELSADTSVCLDVNDLNVPYVDSSVNGEKVSYAAIY